MNIHAFWVLLLTLVLDAVYVVSLNIHNKIGHRNQRLADKTHLRNSKHFLGHNYYNLEQTRRVSASRSIQYLNKCKDLCLSMHELFPFEFKYHRLVYRQVQGDMKYITGECLYAFRLVENNQNSTANQLDKLNKKAYKDQKRFNTSQKQRKWFPWKNLKSFLDLAVVQDATTKEQKNAWLSYSKDCEDDSLQLSESSRVDFKLTLVHSDFQYYESQRFQNLQPFDDFDALFGTLGV